MSDFCKQVKTDENAYAICERMVRDYGYSPEGPLIPVDIYAEAVELAEREEDGSRRRLVSGIHSEDGFEFQSPLNCFLTQRADMRIPWLFDDCTADTQAEWYFERVKSKMETLKSITASQGLKRDSSEYRETLAVKIFDFIKRPKRKGGLGITFDDEQRDPQKNALEVMKAGKATCIEFVILYLALANQAGLEARPVQIHTASSIMPSDHALVGVELEGDNVLFMDLMTGAAGVFPKDRPDARWSFMSKLDLLAHDYNLRATHNLPPGEEEPSYEHMISHMQRALAFAPDDYIILSNLGYVEYKYGDNLERSLGYLMMSAEAYPGDPHTERLIRIVRRKIGEVEK